MIDASAVAQLPSIASSELLAKFHKTTAAVVKLGAMVVTRHGEPSMVLLSVDRYQALEHASSPDLAALTREFDAMYAAMQAPRSAERMAAAFALSPAELGQAALTAQNPVAATR